MHSSETTLTKGSIAKGIIFFSVPILLSNLFQQLYNAIDSAVVGSYCGELSLAAVGSTGSLINLLIGFFLGLSTGASVLYAMYYGAKDYPGLKKLIDTAMILSLGSGVVISILGVLFSRELLIWMDTPEEVLPYAMTYLRIYLAGTIITMVYNVGSGMLRAEGDSKRPLIYLVAGGLTNLVLDLFFVAVLGWGVAGAAAATVIAQGVSAVLTVLRLTKLNEEYRYHPLKMKFDRMIFIKLVKVSVPCGLQSSMFNIANLLVQAKINSFGSVAMAGVAAYSKIDGFVYMPLMALSLAVSTYVGQNIGAGQFSRVRQGIKLCQIMAFCLSALLGITIFFTADYVLNLFTKEAEVKEFALGMMKYMAPFACTFTFSDIFGGAIRGTGETMSVTIISAICICVFRVAWLTIMLRFINDIRIVYLCYPISWVLSSVCITVYYFFGFKGRKKIIAGVHPSAC